MSIETKPSAQTPAGTARHPERVGVASRHLSASHIVSHSLILFMGAKTYLPWHQ